MRARAVLQRVVWLPVENWRGRMSLDFSRRLVRCRSILSISILLLSLAAVDDVRTQTLPQVTLDDLEIGGPSPLRLPPDLELPAGSSVSFRVGNPSFSAFNPVAADVEWSVAPGVRGVSIHPRTGRLTLDPSVTEGTILVRANVEHGRRVLEKRVRVYVAGKNPLVGSWAEVAQIDCATSREVIPEVRIRDLTFEAGGRFLVTWHPFEAYHDYWGTYRYDAATHEILLQVERGNYTPDSIQGQGTLELTRDKLILRKIWLGKPKGSSAPTRCGHVFSK